MLPVLALVLAAAPAALPPHCSWDQPGRDPFTGDLLAAVDHYADIPPEVRARLKQRVAARRWTDVVEIRRDAIVGTGPARYASDIRDMHFGRGQVCASVTRSAWASAAVERGLVYCEDGHCLLLPVVCRNLSRIRREGPAVAAAPEPPVAPGMAPDAAALPAAQVAAIDPSAPAAEALGVVPPVAAADAVVAAAGADLADGAGPGGAPPVEPPYGPAPPDGPLLPYPSPPAVPEPAAGALLLGGLAVLGGLKAWQARRRQRRAAISRA